MAVSKPTASSVPRKPKAAAKPKPGVKRITSKKRFGVVLEDRLIATAADSGDGLKLMRAHPHAYLVTLLCNDAESREAERPAEQAEQRRKTNPLAEKVAAQCEAALVAVDDILTEELEESFELREPSGRAYSHRYGMIRATDRQCHLANLDTSQRWLIDVRGDIPAQVIAKLTAYAKRLQAAAERAQAAVDDRQIPVPKARHRKAVTA